MKFLKDFVSKFSLIVLYSRQTLICQLLCLEQWALPRSELYRNQIISRIWIGKCKLTRIELNGTDGVKGRNWNVWPIWKWRRVQILKAENIASVPQFCRNSKSHFSRQKFKNFIFLFFSVKISSEIKDLSPCTAYRN